MKISYNWLKDYINIDFSSSKLSSILTDLGLEVEGLHEFVNYPGGLEGLVVGQVLSVEKHPNADKLSITRVDINNGEPLHIVCGAPNVERGQKVVVADIGAKLYPHQGEVFEIKKAKIRGVESFGMLCAEDEIGLGQGHDGIMVLPKEYEVGVALSKYIKVVRDSVFEIGLTPNRADAMSHIGVAQDLYAYCLLHHSDEKISLRLPDLKDISVDNKSKPIEIIVEDSMKCPRYSGVLIEDISIKPSPDWLRVKLEALGVKSINNIVDITNFVLWEYGQPLHAFDADKIKGGKVVVKCLEKDSVFTTLDGVNRKLSSDDLMICDANDGMCIAGVYGGTDSGVGENTQRIFLESALFESSSIRRTSQRHGLRTDAAVRFEKGGDIGVTISALKRAANLIQKLGGGVVVSNISDVYPSKIKKNKISLKRSYLDKMLGQNIDGDKIELILKGLDFEILESNDSKIEVEAPYAKVDVIRPADLVEEILRVYGFNNIALNSSMKISLGQNIGQERWNIKNELAKLLVAKGLSEIQNNSLVNSVYWDKVGENIEDDNIVKVLNYSSADLNVLRKNLLFSNLITVSHNINRNNRNIQVFEYGKGYIRDGSYLEKEHLSICLTGSKSEFWGSDNENVGPYYLRKIVEAVFSKLNLDISLSDLEANEFEGFAYSIAKDVVSSGGKVRPEYLNVFDINQDVYFAQIDLDKLISIIGKESLFYKELNKFPSVRRDLSLLINEDIQFKTIADICLKVDRKTLKYVNLFDVYEGKGVESGKKSYAVNFTFENSNKTLTDKEVDKLMKKIISSLEKEIGAKLR